MGENGLLVKSHLPFRGDPRTILCDSERDLVLIEEYYLGSSAFHITRRADNKWNVQLIDHEDLSIVCGCMLESGRVAFYDSKRKSVVIFDYK